LILNGALKQAQIDDVDTLYHYAILSGGDVVGVWEYDLEAEIVLTRLWEADSKLRRRVADAAADTSRVIPRTTGRREALGGRPSDKRAKRLAFCLARSDARRPKLIHRSTVACHRAPMEPFQWENP
jgi:hypothetical protein